MTIHLIQQELSYAHSIFSNVIRIIPSFEITNRELLPYGLKPHTRSVSWIVEQVVTQQAKFNSRDLNLQDVSIDLPDTCLHDCILIDNNGNRFYINIKVTSSGRRTRNDISAVEKLYMQYNANPEYRLIFVVIKFSFDNTEIILNGDNLHVFSPQFLPIYVNPRNDKIQADYYSPPTFRDRSDFLDELRNNSTSIAL